MSFIEKMRLDIPVIIQASNRNETIQDRLWLPLRGKEGMLSFLIHRVREAGISKIVLATSDDEIDNSIVELAKKENTLISRGEFSNLPERLLKAGEKAGGESFVRIMGNAPLIDLEKMNDLLQNHIDGGYDYSYNFHRYGVLWGMGCDIFSMVFLKKLVERELSSSQKQTIGQYIRQNSECHKIFKYSLPRQNPGYKVCVETKKDYELVRELVCTLDEYTEKKVTEYLERHPLIAYYNRSDPAIETGTEKLFFSPRKAENILKKCIPDMLYPISVELTLTNRCNLNCVYCSDLDLRKRQGVGEELEMNTLKELFDDLAQGGTKGVVLEGGGEPTMHPNFAEIVNYAKSQGLAVGLITNGTQELNKELLSKFEWIRVSLDASTEEEYRSLKGVDAFERVIGNIRNYTRYCKTVGIGYVVTKNNTSQIEPLTLRLKELKTSYVQFRPVVDSPELFPDGMELSYLKYYQTEHFSVVTEGMKDNALGGNGGLSCYAHSITSIISGDGSVYICGRLNVYEWLKPIGNIREKSFRRIWYGEERQNQAEQLSNNEFCKKNCPQCRISKFNQMFSRLRQVQSVHFI